MLLLVKKPTKPREKGGGGGGLAWPGGRGVRFFKNEMES